MRLKEVALVLIEEGTRLCLVAFLTLHFAFFPNGSFSAPNLHSDVTFMNNLI